MIFSSLRSDENCGRRSKTNERSARAMARPGKIRGKAPLADKRALPAAALKVTESLKKEFSINDGNFERTSSMVSPSPVTTNVTVLLVVEVGARKQQLEVVIGRNDSGIFRPRGRSESSPRPGAYIRRLPSVLNAGPLLQRCGPQTSTAHTVAAQCAIEDN